MKYTIAIVEDDAAAIEQLQDYFSCYEKTSDDRFTLACFGSGEEFLFRYQPIYDLVLMDICLPGENGMDIAIQLRKMDYHVTLIFVTNLAQFALRGYEVNAFDYILKPVSYRAFSIKMLRALNQVSMRTNASILISYDGKMVRVSSSEIKYVEVSNHDLIYHTVKGNIRGYGNLKQVESQLNFGQFVRCNSCYLVNLNYVQSIDKMFVYLGDDALQMSRNRKKMFIQALNDFLGGGF